MSPTSSDPALAAAVWRQLFEVFVGTRQQRDAVLARLELTPNDSKALSSLQPDEGRSMRVLAEEWGTDASNATWVVDRLVRKGLAERRTPPEDRRVKLVQLTPRGAEVRDEILRAFYEPPAEMLRLDDAELRELSRLLEKLAG